MSSDVNPAAGCEHAAARSKLRAVADEHQVRVESDVHQTRKHADDRRKPFFRRELAEYGEDQRPIGNAECRTRAAARVG